MIKKRIIKAVITLVIFAAVTAVCFIGVQAYVDRFARNYLVTEETAPECEAVMVLGARVFSDGRPSLVLEDRLVYAHRLYSKGKAKKILVSGDHGTKSYDEVNVMKDYLLSLGVPREDIFLDHAGFNTYDSMYRAKNIFQVKTLLISTQNFHISRSVYIARKLGIDAYGYPSRDKKYYPMEYLNLRESFAKVKAFVDTEVFKRKSKYGGDVIPIGGSGILTEG